MKSNVRDLFAIALSIAALALGLVGFLDGRIEPGLDLVRQPDGSVLVAGVWPGGLAYRNGVKVGMFVQYISSQDGIDGVPDAAKPPTGPLDPAPYGYYWIGGPVPGDIAATVSLDPTDGRLKVAGGELLWSGLFVALGLLLRLRPRSVPAGDPALIRRFALPGAAAFAVPMALAPAYLAGTHVGLWSLVLLPALGAWPLVDAASGITRRRVRPIATVLLLTSAAAWLGGLTQWYLLSGLGPSLGLGLIFAAEFAAISAAVLAPRAPAARGFEARLRAGIRWFDLWLVLGAAVAGLAALALSTIAPGDGANVAYLWLAFVAVRLLIVPFVASALEARSSRDGTLDAVEAERVRISSDIHDDVIQELTMLVRRLDAAGDHESATIAREAADRLREITGDARLPVLEDLGVAAALDWLVRRMSAVDRGEITLDAAETARPPRPVELALYRIAQEAIANALRHGEAPVTVRYQGTADRATLIVEDAGPGIPEGAEEIADGAGRLGIAGMRRRAATIGAALRIDRLETGTRVALDWPAE
jgi:signal transduction histidine kinase